MNELEIVPGLLISNDLCLIAPRECTVVISDLHLGYESVLEDTGLHLPRIQNERIEENLEHIIERHKPHRFVILGDLKHEFARNLAQEWSEVRRLLGLLMEQGEVIVVKGNHDNYLASIASKLGVDLVDEYSLAGWTLAHGHEDRPERPLVIGHEHPSIRLYDNVGGCVKMRCFVHLPRQEVLVLPAFSPLAPGTDFTGITSENVFSPVLQRSDMSEARAIACSEIGLLNLGSLAKLPRFQRHA